MVTRFVERIAKIREAIGDDIDLAVDFHGRVSPAMAPWICRELEPYGLMFIEEPVLPENVDVMAKIARDVYKRQDLRNRKKDFLVPRARQKVRMRFPEVLWHSRQFTGKIPEFHCL